MADKENGKVIKLNLDELENVSGGDKYTKVNGNNFEVWFRCPKCNKYEEMIFSHQNDGHMLTKLVLGGTFFCGYCGHSERYYYEFED